MELKKYEELLIKNIKTLMGVDSPSGFTHNATELVKKMITDLGYKYTQNNSGNVVVEIEGEDDTAPLGMSAHLDTLGLMVRSIKDNGDLAFTVIGSPVTPSLDGEYCRIYTREGKVYEGTVISETPAKHVFKDANTHPREERDMVIRLDEVVRNKEDVEKLGIAAGDFICYDTKTVFTSSGFLKSRFIDDKACAGIFLTLLTIFKELNIKPKHKTYICFSVHEEIGYGGATLPRDMKELLVVDMGCIGDDLSCKETNVSICVKDSSGPYDYAMTSRLVELGKKHNLPYVTDIYPMYFSDALAVWRAGYDTRCALIGPGVAASHGMERTHIQGLMATVELILHYVQ